jgi:Na+(H+)/acetate symporter ActP
MSMAAAHTTQASKPARQSVSWMIVLIVICVILLLQSLPTAAAAKKTKITI